MNAPDAAWIKLKMKSALANSVEDIDRNIEFSLKQKYTRFQDILGSESGAVAVVGSGPSLKENWKDLRDSGVPILACNAACQFLLERGVTPKYMFCFDADPLTHEFFTPGTLSKDTTYLIASRISTKVWEMLEGYKVVCWHSAGDKNIQTILEKHGLMEPMITGGSAAVTRAMILVQPIGFKEIHLWGADSSFSREDTHIRQSTTVERRIKIMVNKREFETAPWMCQQAEDFKILVPNFQRLYGMKVIVHGDGLIPHLASTMGLEVHNGEPKYKHVYRSVKCKTKAFWASL